jgi:hypothetical protein
VRGEQGGIARVFGRPKILEVVRDPRSSRFYDDARNPFDAGILPFKTYQSTPEGGKEWIEGASGIRNLLGSRKDRTNNFEQVGMKPDESQAYNPNLSLNIGIKRQPDWVFWVAASVGFLLQTAVLVFAAIITYRLRWEKAGQLPEPWAFPLSFSGTILQCTGMFLCSRLVEQSTKERKFHRNSDPQRSELSTLHWLQPGNQAVGDQIFDAFAYTDSVNPLSQYVSSSKIKGLKPTLHVWVAISVTMSGFLLQFIGLRAMHSSVAVFQLGAMLVMSIIRASLRTQRLHENENHLGDSEMVQGHELDWQALQFEENQHGNPVYWLVRNGPVEKLGDSTTEDGIVFIEQPPGAQSRAIIGFKSVPIREPVRFISEVQKDEGRSVRAQPKERQEDWQPSKPCLAVRLFKYRVRLAQLTSSETGASDISVWEDKHVYARDCARKLKLAIEGTAEILFADANSLKEDWRGISSLYMIGEGTRAPTVKNAGSGIRPYRID